MNELKPIWEKGRRAKITAVAAVAALLGSGGGLSAEGIMKAIQNLLSPPPVPVHGTIVEQGNAQSQPGRAA